MCLLDLFVYFLKKKYLNLFVIMVIYVLSFQKKINLFLKCFNIFHKRLQVVSFVYNTVYKEKTF